MVTTGGICARHLVQEAHQERQIGEIAKEISGRGNVKYVLIAGPSSSGKTTFSHRLAIQLRVNGLIPHPIAVDNYFWTGSIHRVTKTEIIISSVWKPSILRNSTQTCGI